MNYTSPEVYEFISKQIGDPIVEWKTCAISGTKFPITQQDLDFYDTISPSFGGEKYPIPTPTLCPEERRRRRLAFRNHRKLYKRTCAATGKSMIAINHPESGCEVYINSVWRSDQRDRTDKASGTVTQRLQQLMQTNPHMQSLGLQNDNCDYANGIFASKNCYLCFNCDYLEDSLYCTNSNYLKNCMECISCTKLDNCVGCDTCTGSYNLVNCKNCKNSSFLRNCVGCDNAQYCINSSNIVNDSYYIDNKKVTKELFEKYEGLTDETPNAIYETMSGSDNTGVFGAMNTSCKDSVGIYECTQVERSKYCWYVYNATDCYDFDVFGDGSQRVYESLAVGPNCDSILFCSGVRGESARCFYSVYLFACSDCFGCFGLRNAQYCIFNTQYTKEEYEQLVPEIIAQMQPEGTRGEFLSPSLSPFGYNETVAYDLEPLTKTQATQHGYNWTDYTNDIAIPVGAKTLVQGDFSPEEWKILRDDDAILNQIIVCEVTGRPFRVIKKELEICRMHDISLPTKHPDARHQEKLEARMGNTLFLRNCNKTGETMVSNYGAEFEGKVYSHKAYADEVYG